jgi:hypothetical protein
MNTVDSWADDEMLKPWRRGRLDLPFATAERTPAEQHRRLIVFVVVLAAAIFVIIFALLVGFGMVPELYADPKVTYTGERDPWFPLQLSGGAAVIGAAIFAFIAGPLTSHAPAELGHPWRFTATGEDLTITDSEGRATTGAWIDWRLAAYDASTVTRGVPVITALLLALGEREFRVEVLALRHQRKLLRAVAQKIAR